MLAATLFSTPSWAQDHVTVGLGTMVAPVHQGADDYRIIPIPAIDIESGPIYANINDGVGFRVVNTPGVKIGGGVAIMPGYRHRDVPDGVDNLSFGAGARLSARFTTGSLIATVGGTKGFAGSTKGFIADASLSYLIVASPRLIFIPSIATSWADRKHNDRYFGISAEEAQASGLGEFAPGKGFKDVSALVTATYRLNSRISLTATGGVTTLVGDVQDSPLVVHKTQPLGIFSISYRLGR